MSRPIDSTAAPRQLIAALIIALVMLLLAARMATASEALMEKSGCLSCHRVDQKLIGPSFKDIAARYRRQPEVLPTLFQKVREGGEGEWGDIPMAANHEDKVSDANLTLILQWVLSL